MSAQKASATKKQQPWSVQTLTEVFASLDASRDGLSEHEANRRLVEHGPNVIPREKALSWFSIFIRQFENPLILILVVAALITLLLRDFTDTLVIAVAVVLNVVIGFIQEYKAERALDALQSYLHPTAIVLREGREHRVVATSIVPGDILVLRAGDKVSADVRLFEVMNIEANEAALTGESFPVAKHGRTLRPPESGRRALGDQSNMVFMGTVITQGVGRGVVVATGIRSEFGKVAALLHTVPKEKTPLQEKLRHLSKGIAAFVLLVAALLFSIGVAFEKPILDMFTIAVALAVAAIPEGLVVGATAILAIGMQRILKHGALVRRLVAAETLGSTSVICTDKTGTLTEGRMHCERIVTDEHEFFLDHTRLKNDGAVHRALEIAALANVVVVQNADASPDAWELLGSPTERALVHGAALSGFERPALLKQYPQRDIIPFSSDRKYVMTLHDGPGKQQRVFLVGAVERVLTFSNRLLHDARTVALNEKHRAAWEARVQALAAQGYRLIGFGFREERGVRSCRDIDMQDPQFIFVGMAVISDPIRADVPETIREAKEAGIHVIMLTGDHRATAQHIAQQLGIVDHETQVQEGASCLALSRGALAACVHETSVYARVTPEQKLRIVEAWQQRGAVVAVTGDGVNDAPALRRADIGVAVGSGTEVAKEAADVVLLDDSFSTLVYAVREGRVIVDNIKKVALYLLSDSFSEIILISTALFIGIPLPLLASQILWINLVSNGFPHIALTVDPEMDHVMKRLPEPRQRPILEGEHIALIALVSIVTGLANFFLFQWSLSITGDVSYARTLIFASLSIDSLVFVYSLRSLTKPMWRMPFLNNPWLLIAVALGFVLALLSVYLPLLQPFLHTVPLLVRDWWIVVGFAFGIILLIEITKWAWSVFKKMPNSPPALGLRRAGKIQMSNQ